MTDQQRGAVRSYRQGEWFGIFGERVTILLPPTEKARVSALWELADDGAGFEEVLDALVGPGLSSLPGFVLVTCGEDPTRVVVRGTAQAVFVSAAGDSAEVDGTAASTWVERSLPGVASMQVLLGQAGVDDFPVGSGLVRVGQVHQPPYVVPSAFSVPSLGEPSDSAESFDSTESAEEAPGEPVSPPVSEPPPAHEAADLEEPALAPATPKHAATVPQPEPTPPPIPEPTPAPPPAPSPDPTPDPMPAPVPGPEPQPAPAVTDEEPWFPFAEEPEPEPVATAAPPAANPFGVADDPETAPVATYDPDHDGHTVAGGLDPDRVAQHRPGIPGQPQAPSITAVPVARLVFSSGESVDVDRAVLVGRAPEARRFTSTEQPRLVTVPSPHQEISSTHLEVRPGSGVDHGCAVVTDMGSTNGTVLALPGLAPEDLQPGIAVQLIPGSVIDLGDGVTIKVTNP